MNKIIEIEDRHIGPDQPPFTIAEMSGNHNGDVGRALEIIEAAKRAGADAVKLQTYTADTITIDHDGPGFRIQGGLWEGRSLYELYQEAHTPWEWHQALFEKAREQGITIFSAPFDTTAVDFLEDLGCPAYKIASFECVDLPLVEYVARRGKPMIVSTGMATFEEIREVIETIDRAGNSELALLHCVSGYPTPAADSNLRTIGDLADKLDVVVGLSDHTLGTEVSVAAVALGASLIEKHLTLSRADGGPDAQFSLEPLEFERLVKDTRTVWEALGEVSYELKASEKNNMVFRRSLYIVEDVSKGQLFSKQNVRSIRPGHGLPPKYIDAVVGKPAAEDLKRGTPLIWSMIEGSDIR